MSLFSNLFSSTPSSDKPNFPWISLEDLGTLSDLENQSFQKPVFIFKHSTRCSISRFAIKQFENDAKTQNELYSFYYLDLITFRAVSNAIAEQFQIMHQSPQLIVMWKGKVVYVASHSDIDFEKAKSETI
jgi:bacillithiol system protein YtxJ